MDTNKFRVYNLPTEDDIEDRIKRGWGLARVYRWIRDKDTPHGETLILNRILAVGVQCGKPYPKRHIRRVIREDLDEKISAEVRRAIYKVGGHE